MELQRLSMYLVPIGELSKEAAEAKTKDIKQFRLQHTRKTSRTATNTDLLNINQYQIF